MSSSLLLDLALVNCVMGWSRSASVVAAYLIMKHKMKATMVRENKIQTDVIIVTVSVQLGLRLELVNKKTII